MKKQHLFRIIVSMFIVAGLILTSSAFAADPIKIGIMQGLSGPFEIYGKAEVTGFKMGLEWATNGTNKILGRDVELIVEDTQLKPARVNHLRADNDIYFTTMKLSIFFIQPFVLEVIAIKTSYFGSRKEFL